MATNLVVRNVEENVALALKQRAVLHGCSAEAQRLEQWLDLVVRAYKNRILGFADEYA